jgi:hypothetical protein
MSTLQVPDKSSQPEKAYRDGLKGKGSTLSDTNAGSDARDQVKLEKVASGQTQKMDGGNPDADEDDSASDEEIRRETLEKK